MELAPEPGDRVDFGIEALRRQISEKEAAELAAPTANAPVLLPAYANLWSHTSPIPNADPEVALFLHGPDCSPATVQIVWRADIDEQNDLRPAMEKNRTASARLIELFKLVPPRAAEAVEVPLWAARAWLERMDANQADFSDAVEHSTGPDHEPGVGRRAFRWAGEDSDRTTVVHASALRNGDLIVVPAEYGGCDEWGWNPNWSQRVSDVAERAAWPYRARRFAVRITPSLIAQGFPNEPSSAVGSIVGDLKKVLANLKEGRTAPLLDTVLELHLPGEMKAFLQALTHSRRRRLERVFSYDSSVEEIPRGVIFVAPRGIESSGEDAADFEGATQQALAAVPATENNELSAASDRSVPLVTHCRDVRAWAGSFTIRAGLPPDQSDDVTLAAFLHDPGKADGRFQTFFAGGDPYGPDAAEPLAKSGQTRLPAGAWDRAGLPDDWRHEALSVRLAIVHPDLKHAHDRALMLWLIGVHHGYGRPLFPHADPLDAEKRRIELPRGLGGALTLEGTPGPQSLAFDFEGQDWTQIFETLKARYGIWGLARLEAFVRLADHRASEAGAPPQAVRPYKEAAE